MTNLPQLIVFLVTIALCGCTPRPPDDLIKQNIEEAVRIKMVRVNPFANAEASKIESYKITNTYKSGDAMIYEFSATTKVVAELLGNKHEQAATITGAIAFQKKGERWDVQLVQ